MVASDRPPPPPDGHGDSHAGSSEHNDSSADSRDGTQCIGKRTRSRISLVPDQPLGEAANENQAAAASAGADTAAAADGTEGPRSPAPSASASSHGPVHHPTRTQTLETANPDLSASVEDVQPRRSSNGPARAFQRARSQNRSLDTGSSPVRSPRQLRASTTRSSVNAIPPPFSATTSSTSAVSPSPCENTASAQSPVSSSGRSSQHASAMSPPRPTRSLPRRTASAMTASRPLQQSSQSASTSSPYALRSRRSLGSSALSSSNSNANILASGGNASGVNRPSFSDTGCRPLTSINTSGLGGDPGPLSSSSGASAPRTPLAEIPLWLADMRSESRRSSSGSSMLLDQEDPNGSYFTPRPTHGRSRTASSSSTSSSMSFNVQPTSSSGVSTRRSLRDRRPRQSNENDPESMGSQYSQDSDWPDAGHASTLSSTPRGTAGAGLSEHSAAATSQNTPSSSSSAMALRSRTASDQARRSSSSQVASSRTLNPALTPRSPSTPVRQRSASQRSTLATPASPRSSLSERSFGTSVINGSLNTPPSLAERRMRPARHSEASMDLEMVPESVGEHHASSTPPVAYEDRGGPSRSTRSSSRRRHLGSAADPSTSLNGAATPLTPIQTLQPSSRMDRGEQHRPTHRGEVRQPADRHALPWSPSMPSLSLRSSPPFEPPSSQGSTATQLSESSQSHLEPASPSASSTITSLTNASTAADSSVSGSTVPATPLAEFGPGLPFAEAFELDTATSAETAMHGSERTRTRSSAAAAAAAAAAALQLGQGSGLGLQGTEDETVEKLETLEPPSHLFRLSRPQ